MPSTPSHKSSPPTVARRAATRLALGALAVSLVWLAPAPASAQVEVVERADGTRMVVNRAPATSTRNRSASTAALTLRPAPRTELATMVERHAADHDLEPRLVRAVIQVESAWDRRAQSRAGAMGLMQLMPETAVELAVHDPWEEDQNIRGGTAYLAQQIERFGSLELGLAAYNAGPGAVQRYGGIPPFAETREYVRRILSLYHGRPVRPSELVPYHGRRRPRAGMGTSSATTSGHAPGFVRNAEGRLVLTNDPAPHRPRPRPTP